MAMAIQIPDKLEEDIREAAEYEGIDANEFVETALEKALADYHEQHVARETEVWYAMPAEQRRKYVNQYVALFRGQIVDADVDQIELLRRIDHNYGNAPVMITEGGDQPMPTYVIRSPHWAKLNDGD
jgi:hypothetical protein